MNLNAIGQRNEKKSERPCEPNIAKLWHVKINIAYRSIAIGKRRNRCRTLCFSVIQRKEKMNRPLDFVSLDVSLFCYALFQKKKDFIKMMFVPSEGGLPSGMGGGRPGGSSRPSGPPSRLDYVKTFYTDPFKWYDRSLNQSRSILSDLSFRSLVKSFVLFGVGVYFIRDLAANDLLPME